MAYSTRNILVGAAALYLSSADSTSGTLPTAPPAGTVNTPLSTTLNSDGNWSHVGFTSEGVELSYEPDYTDVEVDQLLDSAKIFKSGMRVMVNTTFSEASLLNLLISWGQTAATLAASTGSTGGQLGISAGALGDDPVERALIAVGNAPRGLTGSPGQKRERVYFARRVISVDTTAHALRRAEATVFPISFRLLPDPTASAGSEYGFIVDRNVT